MHKISFFINVFNGNFTYYFVEDVNSCGGGIPTNSTKIEQQRILMIPKLIRKYVSIGKDQCL